MSLIKIQLQNMTHKLSEAFFGNKRFTSKVHEQFVNNFELSRDQIKEVFQPYSSKLDQVKSQKGDATLLDIFIEFIKSALDQFGGWQFQKLSSVIEIFAHAFQYSFQKWLSKQQSFNHFSEVVVRHSLFRPPHSVCVFNYNEIKIITKYWIDNFHRYFEEYRECMASDLQEVLICQTLPGQAQLQNELKDGKLKGKAEIERFLH